ncbi:unnamed protein product [Cuscuta epithymum]|uniref:Transmembrane protein n=1 Tax=Cuscuta epithymum TaxID=186058 RepID=A0AAV0GI03_9ASTE|nr:unnamed protein product [Cuscuta epithymum]
MAPMNKLTLTAASCGGVLILAFLFCFGVQSSEGIRAQSLSSNYTVFKSVPSPSIGHHNPPGAAPHGAAAASADELPSSLPSNYTIFEESHPSPGQGHGVPPTATSPPANH